MYVTVSSAQTNHVGCPIIMGKQVVSQPISSMWQIFRKAAEKSHQWCDPTQLQPRPHNTIKTMRVTWQVLVIPISPHLDFLFGMIFQYIWLNICTCYCVTGWGRVHSGGYHRTRERIQRLCTETVWYHRYWTSQGMPMTCTLQEENLTRIQISPFR